MNSRSISSVAMGGHGYRHMFTLLTSIVQSRKPDILATRLYCIPCLAHHPCTGTGYKIAYITSGNDITYPTHRLKSGSDAKLGPLFGPVRVLVMSSSCWSMIDYVNHDEHYGHYPYKKHFVLPYGY